MYPEFLGQTSLWIQPENLIEAISRQAGHGARWRCLNMPKVETILIIIDSAYTMFLSMNSLTRRHIGRDYNSSHQLSGNITFAATSRFEDMIYLEV